MEIKGVLVLLLAIGQTSAQEFSPCSKPCGGGSKVKTYTCMFGATCQVSVFCNTQPCAPSQFNVFTACSKTCGGGFRFKVESCPLNDVNKCRKVYEDCNVQACTPLESCPFNEKFRYGSKSSCCKKTTEVCTPNSGIETQQRIFGGEKSLNGQWPWMAVMVIRDSKTTHCGGSLIHKDYVLTAAHCIDVFMEKDYYVLLGSTTITHPKATKQIIDIEKFIPHELYSDPLHDIGLVKLKKSAVFDDFVKPICLPQGEGMQLDMTCVAAGWGIARPEDLNLGTTSDVLQHVSLRNLPKDACVNGLQGISWRIAYYNNNDNLCFGILAGDKDTCNGDSGGPIMCQRCSSCGWYIAGTTSYGPNICGTKGQPGVYMYVKSYESWIKNKVPGIPNKYYSC